VPLEKTASTILGGDLSKALAPGANRADVLSFGVGGYTLSQEYLTLHNHIWKYQPQVVILLLSPFAILKTTREFFPGELRGTPIYELQNGELVPDAITRKIPPVQTRSLIWKNRTSDWMNASSLLSLLNIARVKAGELAAEIRIRPQKAAASSGPPELWYYNAEQPETQGAWTIAGRFIQEMKKECDRHGAEFWLVVVDQGIEVHPDLAERAAFQAQMNLTSLDGIARRLERFGAAHEIPVLALGPPLGEYAVSHGAYLHGSPASKANAGHWNELGNELIGHMIAHELLTRSQAVRCAIASGYPSP